MCMSKVLERRNSVWRVGDGTGVGGQLALSTLTTRHKTHENNWKKKKRRDVARALTCCRRYARAGWCLWLPFAVIETGRADLWLPPPPQHVLLRCTKIRLFYVGALSRNNIKRFVYAMFARSTVFPHLLPPFLSKK